MIRRIRSYLTALSARVDRMADPRMTPAEFDVWLRGCPTDDDTEFARLTARLACTCVDCRNTVQR